MKRLVAPLALAVITAAGCAGDRLPELGLPEITLPAWKADAGDVTVWKGKVVIRGTTTIPAGNTLIIKAGTTVLFDYLDENGDGLGESGLFVAGAVRAEGTADEPVVFAPLDGRGNPGLWDTIRFEKARDSRLTGCIFSGAHWALHVHFTDLVLEESRIEHNEGGVRFRGGPMLIRENIFTDNGTAIRYWESDPRIAGNTFSGNGTAIFSRKGSSGGRIEGNDFVDSRDYHVKLGELQEQDIDARGNWWGTAHSARIDELIYDRSDASYLGRVRYEPFAAAPLRPAATAGNPAAPGQ